MACVRHYRYSYYTILSPRFLLDIGFANKVKENDSSPVSAQMFMRRHVGLLQKLLEMGLRSLIKLIPLEKIMIGCRLVAIGILEGNDKETTRLERLETLVP